MLFLTALCWSLSAFAQDIPEEEEEIDLPTVEDGETTSGSGFDLGESKFQVKSDDDDGGMKDFAAEALKRPAEPTHFHLDPTGKKPLANDYPMQVVAIGPEWVKMELPVLVATSRAAFEAEYPHGLRIVTEWEITNSEKVRVEQVITTASLRVAAPTFAFFDIAVQDPRKSSAVRILVRTAALPDPAAKDAEPPALKDRYAVTSVFFRKG